MSLARAYGDARESHGGREGDTMAWRKRRARTLDLAVLQADTTHLQVEALRTEITMLHHELARRDVELISALTRVANACDGLQLHVEVGQADQARLMRAVDRIGLFLTAPPIITLPAASPPAPPAADHGAGSVIGGSIDPSRVAMPPAENRATHAGNTDREPDTTIDLTGDLPIAPATRAEQPLECEVHLQFGDRWIDGFQIEETIRTGSVTQFRLRRQVDGWILPELFDECEVRVFMQPVVEANARD